MAAVDDFDEIIEQYDLALGEFVKGNPDPVKEIFSTREDVTLANPLFPVGHGWEQVAERLERAASNLRDGEMVAFQHVEKYVTLRLPTLCGWSGPRPRLADVRSSPQSLCGLR
jgi:hypothetical protein